MALNLAWMSAIWGNNDLISLFEWFEELNKGKGPFWTTFIFSTHENDNILISVLIFLGLRTFLFSLVWSWSILFFWRLTFPFILVIFGWEYQSHQNIDIDDSMLDNSQCKCRDIFGKFTLLSLFLHPLIKERIRTYGSHCNLLILFRTISRMHGNT